MSEALEGMATNKLRHQGWHVINNIKETRPAELNIPALSGEIDIVTGKPEDKIWLLDVKDPR